MHHEKEDEPAFGELNPERIAPPQKTFEPRFPLDRKPKREEMQRQEDRQRKPGKPVQQRGEP
jgi:hypothetical protein